MYNINILQYDKVKTQKYHSQNLIKQVAETDAKHDCSLYWLGINT